MSDNCLTIPGNLPSPNSYTLKLNCGGVEVWLALKNNIIEAATGRDDVAA